MGAGFTWANGTPLATAPVPGLETRARYLLQSRLESRGQVWTAEEIHRAAEAIATGTRIYGYPPEFILGIIEVESGFKIDAHARDGSVGLMQVKPSTARAICILNGWVVPPENLFSDPGINITLGTAYLHYLEKAFGSRPAALAAYNMGETAARRKLNQGGPMPREAYREAIKRRGELIAQGASRPRQ